MSTGFQRGKGRREPLTDELPYEFLPPRISPFWFRISRGYVRGLIRKQQGIATIEISGAENLKSLIARSDGVLLTPNHASQADAGVIYELSHQIGHPFAYMAAYQIFTGPFGFRRFILPRLGVFPVDREGTDRAAMKTAIEILASARNPLVIFPEGEIYHMADQLTPLREGAAGLAITAARKLADAGKTVWVVPAALKYRYLDGSDPLPAFGELMTKLEAYFTWSKQDHRPLLERLYRYAAGMLALKEIEYFDAPRTGPIRDRVAALMVDILGPLEDRWFGKRSEADPVPVRVKELRHACLEKIMDEKTTLLERAAIRRDLDALFVCIQAFSYPGDYVPAQPTVERVAETLNKFEIDVFGVSNADPRGQRRAILRIGEPIDVRSVLGSGEGRVRPRDSANRLTRMMEERIQAMLDAIGPGRPLPPEMLGPETKLTPRVM